LIREKVARNIEKSNKAAEVLVAMKARKKRESGQIGYELLKEKWQEEMQNKEEEKKERHAKVMEVVTNDYIKRQKGVKCKQRCREGNHQLWAREVRLAEENYEQECVRENTRRFKAEEIQLYNRSLAAEQKNRFEREKMLDHVWAEKMKGAYFDEMQQMKDYASSCMREWTGKGRSIAPLQHAMKKWEWDSAMDPRMFRQWEQKKAAEKAAADAARGDEPNGFAEVIMTQFDPNICAKSTVEETTQTTARRLGFC